MATLELRPRFDIRLPWDADEAMRRIRESIARPPLAGRAASLGLVADFRIPPQRRRLWSPHLSIEVEPHDEGALLRGRFSPRPEIWTGIMLVYFSVVFLMVCGGAFAYAQWAMGQTAWGLASLPLGATVIAAIHAASLVGQRWSEDQMRELRDLLDQALELSAPPSAPADPPSDPADPPSDPADPADPAAVEGETPRDGRRPPNGGSILEHLR